MEPLGIQDFFKRPFLWVLTDPDHPGVTATPLTAKSGGLFAAAVSEESRVDTLQQLANTYKEVSQEAVQMAESHPGYPEASLNVLKQLRERYARCQVTKVTALTFMEDVFPVLSQSGLFLLLLLDGFPLPLTADSILVTNAVLKAKGKPTYRQTDRNIATHALAACLMGGIDVSDPKSVSRWVRDLEKTGRPTRRPSGR